LNPPKFDLVRGQFYTFINEAKSGERVAFVTKTEYGPLLATSGELLEALETISDFLEANGHPREAAEARAVIHKARGDK